MAPKPPNAVDEDGHDAAAEEARPAVLEVVIGVEKVEDLAKDQRDDQKKKSDRRNCQKNAEGIESRKKVHKRNRCGSAPTLGLDRINVN